MPRPTDLRALILEQEQAFGFETANMDLRRGAIEAVSVDAYTTQANDIPHLSRVATVRERSALGFRMTIQLDEALSIVGVGVALKIVDGYVVAYPRFGYRDQSNARERAGPSTRGNLDAIVHEAGNSPTIAEDATIIVSHAEFNLAELFVLVPSGQYKPPGETVGRSVDTVVLLRVV